MEKAAKKLMVWSEERGLRTLKEGADFNAYKEKYPTAQVVTRKQPTMGTLERWALEDGVCKALDGCRVEPDGHCPHGMPSWLLALKII